MTPQYILRAAIADMRRGTQSPWCNGENRDRWIRDAENELDSLDWCRKYGKPGYSDPVKGIILGDWNKFPSRATELLEQAGFSIEWSDEWIISYETSKAYRTSPDCYSWTPYYILTNDGEVIGGDEIESGDQADWYVNEYLLNDPTRANIFKLNLTTFGFKKFNGKYETGFHPGQNDDPKKVFKAFRAQHPDVDIVFSIDNVGQFDTHWTAWIRTP